MLAKMIARLIDAFISRGIYNTEEEVIYAAMRALIREQLRKEADRRINEM